MYFVSNWWFHLIFSGHLDSLSPFCPSRKCLKNHGHKHKLLSRVLANKEGKKTHSYRLVDRVTRISEKREEGIWICECMRSGWMVLASHPRSVVIKMQLISPEGCGMKRECALSLSLYFLLLFSLIKKKERKNLSFSLLPMRGILSLFFGKRERERKIVRNKSREKEQKKDK